jgi:Ca-activated chloride channel family protein
LSSGNDQPKGRYILLGIGLIFLIVALANPQLGTKSETIKAERTDIYILLDISASMDTRDVSPSRLERAKKWLSELIVKRKGDRIGLILFAGSAYLQMPLTVDYAAAMMFIQNASTQLAGSQGTAIGEAIKLAVTSKKQDTPGMMLIISDGEDHDGEAIEQAELAMEEGWVVSTISVGTPSGGPVPDEAGMPGDYKEDNSGNQVISVPNRKLMAEIAKTAEGEAFHSDLNDEDLLQALDAHIDTMKTREVEVRSYADYQSYFQYFLLPGLVLLLFIYVKWYA